MSQPNLTTRMRALGYETEQDMFDDCQRAYQMTLATEVVALHCRVYEHNGIRGYVTDWEDGPHHFRFIEPNLN